MRILLLTFCLFGLAPFGFAQYEGDAEEGSVDPESIIEELNETVEETEEEQGYGEDYESDPQEEDVTDPASVLDDDQTEAEYEEPAEEQPVAAPRRSSGPAMVAKAPKKTKVFGDYKIHIGVSKPEFDKSDEYELVYGNSRFYPTLSVEYYFFDWYATLGMIFRLGYYKDDGNAVIQEGDSFVTDEQGETELTLVPLHAGISAQMTPFPAKWITLAGWFAGEATYFQEIRKTADDSEETETTTPATTDSDDTASTTSDNNVLMNQGWRYGTNVGVALSFLLNGLDETSVRSLNPIGISAVYFTPYVEATTGVGNSSDLEFNRIAYGAAFTFETF